jgi:hypothetical protein
MLVSVAQTEIVAGLHERMPRPSRARKASALARSGSVVVNLEGDASRGHDLHTTETGVRVLQGPLDGRVVAAEGELRSALTPEGGTAKVHRGLLLANLVVGAEGLPLGRAIRGIGVIVVPGTGTGGVGRSNERTRKDNTEHGSQCLEVLPR